MDDSLDSPHDPIVDGSTKNSIVSLCQVFHTKVVTACPIDMVGVNDNIAWKSENQTTYK
jgi:hypothetical protein